MSACDCCMQFIPSEFNHNRPIYADIQWLQEAAQNNGHLCVATAQLFGQRGAWAVKPNAFYLVEHTLTDHPALSLGLNNDSCGKNVLFIFFFTTT